MDGRPQKSLFFRFYEDRLNSMFELTKRFPVNGPQLLLLSCTFVRRTSMDMSVSQNNKNGPAKGIYGVTGHVHVNTAYFLLLLFLHYCKG